MIDINTFFLINVFVIIFIIVLIILYIEYHSFSIITTIAFLIFSQSICLCIHNIKIGFKRFE